MTEIRPGGLDTSTPLNLSKRLALIQRFTGSLEGRRVLDCGCGAGDYVEALRRQGAGAAGIEYEVSKLAGNSARRLTLTAGDIERMPFGDSEFDLVLVNEVLEHVPRDREGLREIHRVTKPGGALAIFSPNRLYPFETHGVVLKRSGRRLPPYIPAIPYLPLPLGRLVFDYWARNYWPWQLRRLIESSNFQLLGGSFVWQTFENISGRQPKLLTRMSPFLRALATRLERVPGVRWLGVSQMIYARRSAI